jgi:hypothetical protein
MDSPLKTTANDDLSISGWLKRLLGEDVIPVKAGIQRLWTPACAGVTQLKGETLCDSWF